MRPEDLGTFWPVDVIKREETKVPGAKELTYFVYKGERLRGQWRASKSENPMGTIRLAETDCPLGPGPWAKPPPTALN